MVPQLVLLLPPHLLRCMDWGAKRVVLLPHLRDVPRLLEFGSLELSFPELNQADPSPAGQTLQGAGGTWILPEACAVRTN